MSKSSDQESWWLEAAKTVGLSLLLAFGIRSYVAEARYIPSGSMEPTLQVNDRLIIEKITYYFHQPQRGDIVVFNPTQSLRAQGFKDAFIKRVIGVPGDRVAIQDGRVYINDRQLAEAYVANNGATSVETCSLEGVSAFLSKPVKIPDGKFLVLGDNRNNSYDGRCWGLVSQQEIVGRASFRFWPINRTGTLPVGEAKFLN
ncbi:MAG: signal peptidase I [Thermosynechococcaceae cyanobacterium MS004]|nr:signal peptidase I [Thermosynechococcaceae cyanobacterium MS004]